MVMNIYLTTLGPLGDMKITHGYSIHSRHSIVVIAAIKEGGQRGKRKKKVCSNQSDHEQRDLKEDYEISSN